jgi:hypothetical protein
MAAIAASADPTVPVAHMAASTIVIPLLPDFGGYVEWFAKEVEYVQHFENVLRNSDLSRPLIRRLTLSERQFLRNQIIAQFYKSNPSEPKDDAQDFIQNGIKSFPIYDINKFIDWFNGILVQIIHLRDLWENGLIHLQNQTNCTNILFNCWMRKSLSLLSNHLVLVSPTLTNEEIFEIEFKLNLLKKNLDSATTPENIMSLMNRFNLQIPNIMLLRFFTIVNFPSSRLNMFVFESDRKIIKYLIEHDKNTNIWSLDLEGGFTLEKSTLSELLLDMQLHKSELIISINNSNEYNALEKVTIL